MLNINCHYISDKTIRITESPSEPLPSNEIGSYKKTITSTVSESELSNHTPQSQESVLIHTPQSQESVPPCSLQCSEPTFCTSEFSGPSEYLNNVLNKGCMQRNISMSKSKLLKKVKDFESYLDIDFDHGSTEYIDQYLAIAYSHHNFDDICGEKKSLFAKTVQDFSAIKKIILIPRSKIPMAYCIDHLGRQFHGTVLKSHSSFQSFMSIFDHVPVQRIHWESSRFRKKRRGIDILSPQSEPEVAKLSRRLW